MKKQTRSSLFILQAICALSISLTLTTTSFSKEAATSVDAATEQPTINDSQASDPGKEDAPKLADDDSIVADQSDDSDPASDKSTLDASPEDELIAIAFKEIPVEKIFSLIGEKLGKPVIPHESLAKKKITIHSSRKLTWPKALQILTAALKQRGIIMQEYPLHIEFLPIEEVRSMLRQVVPADQSITTLEDKSQIVDKVFAIKHYDVEKIKDVIVPMLPAYGFVIADPNVRKLIVTDTVANLEGIEQVIAHLDIPAADQTVKKIIPVEYQDASEVLATVRIMIAGSLGKQARDVFSGDSTTARSQRSSPQRGRNQPGSPGRAPGGSSSQKDAETSMFVTPNDAPVLLRANVSRNEIIAVAPTNIMAQIEQWVAVLDQPQTVEAPFEIFEVKFADIQEVSQQVIQMLAAMPGGDINESTRVVPFLQSRRMAVIGSQHGRDFVRELLKKLDIESSGNQLIQEFVLQYSDAEEVADKIQSLFSNRQISYQGYGYTRYRSRGPEPVKVTFDTRRNSVTVVTDPIRMTRIEKLIKEEWDKQPTEKPVLPKDYHLIHVDPVKVKELLEDLFSTQRSTIGSFWNQQVLETNPIGRLAGQFTFVAMPDSNILMVSTKTAENYKVIDELIERLDCPEQAGLPVLIELKHANAEDLSEQLNSLLAERGTFAKILRSKRGLGTTSYQAEPVQESNRPNQQNNNRQPEQQQMQFWWEQGSDPPDHSPASNLIGKPRIVPVPRRNALLVLAPPAYTLALRTLIEDLDKPGMGVVIHAIIAEIQHDDQTTLGIRLAADPSVFNDPRLLDSAFGAGVGYDSNRLWDGNVIIGDALLPSKALSTSVNLNVLVQMLIKNFGLKVLLEPRIHVIDNEEAQFFDGDDVPVQTSTSESAEGGRTVNQIEYRQVGTLVRVFPHITPDGDVDLTIIIEISRQAPTEGVLGNPVFNRRATTTHVVVKNNQTIMLSGIVRQDEFTEVRKWPLFGDLPLVGGLFRSYDKGIANREMLMFITPHVARPGSEEERILQEKYLQDLKRIQDAHIGEDKDDKNKDNKSKEDKEK